MNIVLLGLAFLAFSCANQRVPMNVDLLDSNTGKPVRYNEEGYDIDVHASIDEELSTANFTFI